MRFDLKAVLLTALGFVLSVDAAINSANNTQSASALTINGIPQTARTKYMRLANEALLELSGPCPFAAFGAVIVNHTANAVVCRGANSIRTTGNPTLHGETAAINACTDVLRERGLTPSEISAAWKELSIYTNAESCPMCASAIRWAGFKEYIYGTTIQYLSALGWKQIAISSHDVFEKSSQLSSQTAILGQILREETDHLFSWQFNQTYPCPTGCTRQRTKASSNTTTCAVSKDLKDQTELKGTSEFGMFLSSGTSTYSQTAW